MKKAFVLALCLLGGLISNAQSSKDDVALMQSLYGLSKQQMIEQNMKITVQEHAVFWKLYDEYEASRRVIGQKRADNIMKYAENYGKLTNEKAEELVNASFAIISEFSKLQQSTYKKMAKALTPVRAAQFIQLEMYLENVVRVEIADQIPFVGEFPHLQKK